MARAIWSGAISFGLVNVPVKLYSATSPKTVRFHQLSSKTGARIRQKRVDASTADQVDIDPIYYDHNYYLAPTAGGAKAYRLLLDAMREAGKVGIGRVVLRSKQQLCALRPTGDVLTLTTMLFGDEVLAPDRIEELDDLVDAEATDRELSMAQQLINSLSAEFDPSRFRDEYRERVLELIEKKAAGQEIAVQPEAEEAAAAPDLMAALEASLAAVTADGDDTPAP